MTREGLLLKKYADWIERVYGDLPTEFAPGPPTQLLKEMRADIERMAPEELIRTELEEMATNFEDAGPDAPWTGQEIADAIRDRIKNHHFYANRVEKGQ